MKNEINLLSRVQATKKRIRKLFIVSVAVFSICMLSSAIILGYSFVLNSNLASLNSKITDMQGKIVSLSKQKEAALRIRERLSSIQKLLIARKDLGLKADDVLSVFPDSVGVDEFKVTDDIVSIKVHSANLSDFDSLVSGKISGFAKANKLGIKKVDVLNFSSDKNGYLMAFDFYYKVKK